MAKRNFSSRQGGGWNDDGFSSKKMRTPDEVSVKFLLPNVVVGALLSRKAAALKRIRDQTCYNKDFVLKLSGKDQFYPGSKDERMIALVGPPPLVHRACCLLQDQIIDDPFLVTDEAGTNEMGPRQGQLKIAVSDRAASKIIGSKGAVVKDISAHFNIAITITPSKEVIVPDERIVTILGPSRNVFDALEPIMHQISQQSTHISPEFEYYAQYTKTDGGKEESQDEVEGATATEVSNADESEGKSEEKSEEEPSDEKADVSEAPEASQAIKEEPQEDVSENKPEADADEAIEVKAESDVTEKTEENSTEPQEGNTKPDSEEPSDDPSDDKKKENPDESAKKLLKDPRKDGRWIWQSDRNNRPKWVWVESQKNSGFSPASRRGRGGNRNRGGRYWH